MDRYRIADPSTPPPPDAPPNRRRAVHVAIALSALGHVALLAFAFLRAPTPPAPPRTAEVQVLMGQISVADGMTAEPGVRMDGYARARVRVR